MTFMWADTLFAVERAHLLRLILWGGTSLLAGTAALAVMRLRHLRSALLAQFAIQTAIWGAIDLTLGVAGLGGLERRDLAGATQLDRFLWLNVGLDLGYMMVGATLLLVGWRVARRPALMGAGLGVIVQGAALVILDLLLANQIIR